MLTPRCAPNAATVIHLVVCASVVLPPRVSSAETGFEVAARVGYSQPFGGIDESAHQNLGEVVEWQTFLWMDLGYRVSPRVFVGGYVSGGSASLGQSLYERCEISGDDYGAAWECDANVYRFGGQVHYRVFEEEPITPWVGAGLGWEVLTLVMAEDYVEESVTLSGFEILNIQAGLDFSALEILGLGPYAEASLGRYTSSTVECEPDLAYSIGTPRPACEQSSGSIDDRVMHGWGTIGLRLRLGPL
jgi:outer membrane protein